ncbi:TIGR03016 family PEP-CTERM system-associated outer membrane protein [Roseomonas haemaphysalidis]|nr:TIGR03016 family PEP-CTERM system-associated outer membrane protein [Roseomonas haemaphysalidis]
MRAELMRGTSLAAAATWLALASPAHAQPRPLSGSGSSGLGSGSISRPGILSGSDVAEGASGGADSSPVRLGDFGLPFGSAVDTGADAGQQRGWNIVPSLGISQLATDNINQTRRNKQAEFVTSITPGVLVTMDTARAQGVVSYDPSYRYYANGTSQSGVDHNFNGQVLLTLVPEFLFLDLRGSASRQAAGGGYNQGGENTTSRDNTIQTTSFQISPYILQRFGGTANLQLGYAFQSVTQDSRDNTVLLGPNGLPYFQDQDFTAHEFYAVVRSGEEFGRLALEGRLISTDYIGTGVLDGAYRRTAAVEGRYAINRFVSALGEIGFEEQRYSGLPPFELSEAIWSVGTRLTFSEDSWVTVRYGHHDGFNSVQAEGTVGLGVRTRLYGSYGERIGTGAQRAADLLTNTTLDDLGNPVDRNTGGPIVQPFANSLLGVQSSVMRTRTGTATISQGWDRDTFSLTLLREERTPVSVDPGTFTEPTSGNSASFTWSHSLSPSTSTSLSLQYGTYESARFGDGNVYSVQASLFSELKPGLVGSLQLISSSRSNQASFDRSRFDRFGDNSSGRALQNTIIAGLRQTF